MNWTALLYAGRGGDTHVWNVGEAHLPTQPTATLADGVSASIGGTLLARLSTSLSSELEAAELEVRL